MIKWLFFLVKVFVLCLVIGMIPKAKAMDKDHKIDKWGLFFIELRENFITIK